MGYITETDLKNALNANVWIHLFDDDGDGVVSNGQSNVTLVITRAHAEVLSYLPNLYTTIPSDSPVISILQSAELDFAYTLALERRPELGQTMGEPTMQDRWKRAQERMERLQKGIQRITDNPPGGAAPANIGGQVRSGDPDNPDPPAPFFLNGMGTVF